MSDLNLLLSGCVVSFVVLGGVYVFVREGFLRQGGDPESGDRHDEAAILENSEAG